MNKLFFNQQVIWLTLLIGFHIEAKAEWLNKELISQGYTMIQMGKLVTGHDTVYANINGVDALFIVDTGAITAINQSLEPKYNLSYSSKLNTKNAAGAAGLIKVDFFPVNNVSIGGIKVPITQIGSSDLNAVTQGIYNVSGKYVDGLIGQDALMLMQAHIDVKHNHLYIKNKDKFKTKQLPKITVPKTVKTIQLDTITSKELGIGFLSSMVKINEGTGLLLLDSGAGRSMLNQADLPGFSLDKKTLISSTNTSGAGGGFGMDNHQLESFEIGNIKIKQNNVFAADISVLVEYIKHETGIEMNGVFGQDVLSKHEAIIDVAGHKLYFRK